MDDALLGKMIKCQDCHAMAVAEHTPEPNASAAQKAASPHASAHAAAPSPAAQGRPSPAQPAPAPRPPAPRVIFSTGDIPGGYEVIDLVFAHGNSSEGAMKGAPPVQAFQMLVNWLGQTAVQIGANAVINIRLDFRVLSAQGFLGAKQGFEVYGYGTAVKVLS